MLLGHRDAYFLQLARLAAIAFISAAVIAIGSYVILYRRFDRVMLHSFEVSRRRARRWPVAGNPARAAVRDFTAATLRRSALHQGVVIGLSACGVALAMNSLLRNGMVTWLRGFEVSHREILGAIAGMPFPLIVVMGIAARASLALPVEPKANWVFRVTERDTIRADELHAAERVITLFAAIIPVALTLPIQWMVAGPRAIVASAMTGVFGFLWVEALLTCSYMPGKHSVAQSSLIGLSVFLIVSTIGSALETASLLESLSTPDLVIVAVRIRYRDGVRIRYPATMGTRDVGLTQSSRLFSRPHEQDHHASRNVRDGHGILCGLVTGDGPAGYPEEVLTRRQILHVARQMFDHCLDSGVPRCWRRAAGPLNDVFFRGPR